MAEWRFPFGCSGSGGGTAVGVLWAASGSYRWREFEGGVVVEEWMSSGGGCGFPIEWQGWTVRGKKTAVFVCGFREDQRKGRVL